jgi:hypothetical protein
MKNMQHEIECPRCYDIMTLSSDFDKLLYFCQECHLSFDVISTYTENNGKLKPFPSHIP